MMQVERTRLFVDGVPTTITADVAGRGDEGMVVTQALPFLRLDTAVTSDDGRRTRIDRVAIAMDGDLPRLLLVLRDEEIETPIGQFFPGISIRKERSDSTLPYDFQVKEKNVESQPQASVSPVVIIDRVEEEAPAEPETSDVCEPALVATRAEEESIEPMKPVPWWARFAWGLAWIWSVLARSIPVFSRG